MTIKQIIGLILILSPFIVGVSLMLKVNGWEAVGFVFGVTATVVIVTGIGAYLLNS